jgi:hypothetical protein
MSPDANRGGFVAPRFNVLAGVVVRAALAAVVDGLAVRE